jgi:ABC-type Na+ efflux pump permease subunit
MTSLFSNIWFIAKNDIRFALKDRATLLWLVLMPPIFFFFIGNMTAGGFGNMMTESVVVMETPTADDAIGQRLASLLSEGGFAIEPLTNGNETERRVALSAAEDGSSVDVTYFAGKPTPTTDFEVLKLQRAVMSLRAELAILALRDDGPGELSALAAEPAALSLDVTPAGRLGRVPTGFEQAIPGIMVMFTMLVLLTSGGIILLLEREQGMLCRLASSPISRGEIIAGKWLGRMLLAIAQIGFAMVVGTALFGMVWGPSLPMIIVVLLGWATFCASLGLLVGAVGRNQAEVGGIGMFLTMIMAALGGAWWPIEVTPDWMQSLQKVVPAGWTMDSIHRLVSFGDAPVSALPHLIALVLSAAFLGWIAARVFKFA